MGYHKNKISKGYYKEFSKIKEEFEELEDAYQQGDPILQLCEMADLIGAIEAYSIFYFGIGIEKIIDFNNKTKEAFKEGSR